MAQFILTINLGADAMRTRDDISLVLEDLAIRMKMSVTPPGSIRDRNGNTVGSWQVI